MKIILTGIDPNNPATWQNAGGRAMLYFFNLLTMIGVDCDINAPVVPDDIVVYPDCVQGNPCNAAKIVRYMLYFWPGERIAASECVICYHESYFDQVAQKYDRELPVENIVYLPTIEPGLFYPEEKTVEAFVYPGKRNVTELPSVEGMPDLPVIGKGSMSRADFAAKLRKTKRLYSLDHHTIVFTEAALCGCESWRVEEGHADRVIIDHPEQHVMNPERDVAQARKLLKIVTEFFK